MTVKLFVCCDNAPRLKRVIALGAGVLAVSLMVSGCGRRTTTTTTTYAPVATAAPQAVAAPTSPAPDPTSRAEPRTAARTERSDPSTFSRVSGAAADATGSTISAAARNASGGGSARSSLIIPAGLAVAALGIAQVEQGEEEAAAAALLPPGVPPENLRIGEDRCYYYVLPDQSGGLGRVIEADGTQMCLG